MPRWLLYLWALPTTMVGLLAVVPTLVTGGSMRCVRGCLEIHGGFSTWFLGRFGASAMTLGHVIVATSEQAHHRTREHERVHVRQVERWGPLFLPAYGIASLLAWWRGWDHYLDNRFEREAFNRSRPT
jgi:hypothetical protein